MGRIVIDDVRPRTPRGWPAKATVGEAVPVTADVFKDGHDLLAARVRLGEVTVPLLPLLNDRWEGIARFDAVGAAQFRVEAWVDRYATWRRDVRVKAGAGQDVETELEEGALLLEELAPLVEPSARSRVDAAGDALRSRSSTLQDRLDAGLDDALAAVLAGVVVADEVQEGEWHPVWVDRERALFNAWYELFPRSEGGLAGAAKRLPAVAGMGFDLVYLPPIHPIGRTARKGRNNALVAVSDHDVGSPWAIGDPGGGHKAVHPELGTIEDFDAFVAEASSLGLEVALDYALQCSPDHPWVREHPAWFHHRPDGTIKYAENPPKKYQDIYPINFWPASDAERVALWQACRDILEHWVDHGVRIFRVDNPHTKPVTFWAWLLPVIRERHPDVLFLAEAFTRPKMMAKLAEVGFTLSYTYFTWRTTKAELTDYVTELTVGPTVDYMRPCFWPNTPDILAGPLRHGSPAAFRLRLVLAATLVPSYGIYSGYELCENEPQSDINEEYLHSEKYELKTRDWDWPGSLAPLVTTLNRVRHAHAAFQNLRNVHFHGGRNDQLLVYSRTSDDGADVVLCVVNLDPAGVQGDTLWLDLDSLGLHAHEPFDAHDELTGDTYRWHGPDPYVRLDPAVTPAHILVLRQSE